MGQVDWEELNKDILDDIDKKMQQLDDDFEALARECAENAA